MSGIITAKAEQCPEFRQILAGSNVNTVFAQCTYDNVWGTGIGDEQTVHTLQNRWPGKNMIGIIIGRVAATYRPSTKAWRKNSRVEKKLSKLSAAGQFDVAIMQGTMPKHSSRKPEVRKSLSAGASPVCSSDDSDMDQG